MHKLSKLILLSLSLLAVGSSYAQLNGNCPGCAINTAQFGSSVTDFSVGLFPDTIVVTQNSPVNIDVTYLLPKQANTGISIAPTATVTEVQILGVNGSTPLPTGLSVTCDQTANSCAYYPQTYRYGCVKICGTTPDPATNGFVLAQISVAGTGSAAGQTQTQNQNINFYYKILPDTTACHTVCFQNKINSGCDSATLSIYPGIDISCADPILHPCSFAWDYGNGQTGTGLTNQSATYTTPGAYPVTLTKKTAKLQISSAAISTVSGWSNICNGYNFLNPGANNYQINVTDGSNTNSTPGGGSGAATFNGLNWDVTNQAVAIVVQDNCLLTTLTSSAATLTITGPGTFQWSVSGSNAASGSITVVQVPNDSVSYVDSAYIYASPDTPVISYGRDTVCQGDSVMLTISGALYSGYKISWYQDSTYLSAYTDTFAYAHTSGNYYVKVQNQTTHCQAISGYTPIVESGTVPFSATIYYDNSGNQLFLNPFLPTNQAEWYHDSMLVGGQTGGFLPNLGNGTYYVYVFPTGFRQCALLSNVFTLNLANGINETPGDVTNLNVFPNPNNGTFAINVNVLTPGNVSIKLTDMLGRVVYEKSLVNQTGEIKDNVNVSELAKNVYTLDVMTDKGHATKRVVID